MPQPVSEIPEFSGHGTRRVPATLTFVARVPLCSFAITESSSSLATGEMYADRHVSSGPVDRHTSESHNRSSRRVLLILLAERSKSKMSKNLWLNTVRRALYSYSHRNSRRVWNSRWISGEPLEQRIPPGDLAGVTSAFAAPPIGEFLQRDAATDLVAVMTFDDMDLGDSAVTMDVYLGSLGGVGLLSVRTLSV